MKQGMVFVVNQPHQNQGIFPISMEEPPYIQKQLFGDNEGEEKTEIEVNAAADGELPYIPKTLSEVVHKATNNPAQNKSGKKPEVNNHSDSEEPYVPETLSDQFKKEEK